MWSNLWTWLSAEKTKGFQSFSPWLTRLLYLLFYSGLKQSIWKMCKCRFPSFEPSVTCFRFYNIFFLKSLGLTWTADNQQEKTAGFLSNLVISWIWACCLPPSPGEKFLTLFVMAFALNLWPPSTSCMPCIYLVLCSCLFFLSEECLTLNWGKTASQKQREQSLQP